MVWIYSLAVFADVFEVICKYMGVLGVACNTYFSLVRGFTIRMFRV